MRKYSFFFERTEVWRRRLGNPSVLSSNPKKVADLHLIQADFFGKEPFGVHWSSKLHEQIDGRAIQGR